MGKYQSTYSEPKLFGIMMGKVCNGKAISQLFGVRCLPYSLARSCEDCEAKYRTSAILQHNNECHAILLQDNTVAPRKHVEA
jgi:hypothetical protein